MKKPDSLRAAIAALLPDLAVDPESFRMWIDAGSIRAPMNGTRGFAWAFTLNLLLTDFTGHPSVVFLAINDWLVHNQPALLQPGGPAYAFEADIIDAETIDLSITLNLTEQVVLVPRAGGGWDLQHLDEPVLFSDDFALVEPPSLLRQIWHDGELIVE